MLKKSDLRSRKCDDYSKIQINLYRFYDREY